MYREQTEERTLYESEVATLEEGEGSDPLADLLTLFRPRQGNSRAADAGGAAWTAMTESARRSVLRLIELRGRRLAAQAPETRPRCARDAPETRPR